MLDTTVLNSAMLEFTLLNPVMMRDCNVWALNPGLFSQNWILGVYSCLVGQKSTGKYHMLILLDCEHNSVTGIQKQRHRHHADWHTVGGRATWNSLRAIPATVASRAGVMRICCTAMPASAPPTGTLWTQCQPMSSLVSLAEAISDAAVTSVCCTAIS